MAVILKTGLTLTKLVNGLWFDADSPAGIMNPVTELESANYYLAISPSQISIMYEMYDGVVTVSSLTVKADILMLAVKGKLGSATRAALRKKILTLLDTAHMHLQKNPPPSEKPYIDNLTKAALSAFKADVMTIYQPDKSTINKVAAIKKLRESVNISLFNAKKLVEEWASEDEASPSETIENPKYKSTKSHIMDLVDAKHLHQAVYGTSTGSRYFVIALGDDAKVAVRIRHENEISIKAICMKAPQSKAGQKVKAGFERASLKKSKGGYDHWSLHLNPTNMEMAERAIGSTLFAMGIPFWAVTGNLSVLAGK